MNFIKKLQKSAPLCMYCPCQARAKWKGQRVFFCGGASGASNGGTASFVQIRLVKSSDFI